jgi:glycosyltransferase involved in cell wall biosynthesis
MKISIVTISFNQARFLEQAILSVITQNYPNIQYIVVDPGSTDGSLDIIKKYRDHIDAVIFEKDRGPADGLNKGFSFASGDIFGYLNSDDYYLPSTFEKVVQYFQNYQDADVIYGNGYIANSTGIILKRFYSDDFTPWRFVHKGCVVMQQSTFFRRNAFQSIGGFNTNNPIWWDAELLLDFVLAYKKTKRVNDFLSVFRLHNESISGQKGLVNSRAKELDVLRKKTHSRLYNKVMGKPLEESAKVFFALAYIQKIILQPKGMFWKVLEKTGFNNIEIDND